MIDNTYYPSWVPGKVQELLDLWNSPVVTRAMVRCAVEELLGHLPQTSIAPTIRTHPNLLVMDYSPATWQCVIRRRGDGAYSEWNPPEDDRACGLAWLIAYGA